MGKVYANLRRPIRHGQVSESQPLSYRRHFLGLYFFPLFIFSPPFFTYELRVKSYQKVRLLGVCSEASIWLNYISLNFFFSPYFDIFLSGPDFTPDIFLVGATSSFSAQSS